MTYDPLTAKVIRVSTVIQCTGTDFYTYEVWSIGNDTSCSLKCLFYHNFKTLSSKTMKTTTYVYAIQCRVQANVADRPCRI